MVNITAKEMRESGLLQEVNRQFFHPIGLALYVEEETNNMGVLDYREDAEGVTFEKPSVEKATNVSKIQQARMIERVRALGFWIQPLDHSTEHHSV